MNNWTSRPLGLRVWGWPCSEHLPRHPLQCSIRQLMFSQSLDALLGLELCLCYRFLQVWVLCGNQRPSPGSKSRGMKAPCELEPCSSKPGASISIFGWYIHIQQEQKSPLENTIFNFLFISGMQARLNTSKTWCCNNLFCLFLLLFLFFFPFSFLFFFKWGNAAFIPLWKGWSERTGTDDTSAAKIFWRKPKPKCKRLKRQLPHKPND